jgi:hypothetical protein
MICEYFPTDKNGDYTFYDIKCISTVAFKKKGIFAEKMAMKNFMTCIVTIGFTEKGHFRRKNGDDTFYDINKDIAKL